MGKCEIMNSQKTISIAQKGTQAFEIQGMTFCVDVLDACAAIADIYAQYSEGGERPKNIREMHQKYVKLVEDLGGPTPTVAEACEFVEMVVACADELKKNQSSPRNGLLRGSRGTTRSTRGKSSLVKSPQQVTSD